MNKSNARNGGNGTTTKNGGRRAKNGNGRNGNGGAKTNTLGRVPRVFGAAYTTENRRPVNNNTVTLSGSDFITKIRVGPKTASTDRIIATFPVTPSGYPGTRITQLSQLYERYRLMKFTARYVPAVPVTLACQLCLYIDLDPNDDPSSITDFDNLVRQAVAQTGAQQWNFITPKSIPIAMRKDDQLYYTGEDILNPRFTQQGTAYLIQITNPVNSTGEELTSSIEAGSIFIDWTCQFQTPQINPESQIALASTSAASVYDFSDEPATTSEGRELFTFAGLIPRMIYLVTISLQGAGPITADWSHDWGYSLNPTPQIYCEAVAATSTVAYNKDIDANVLRGTLIVNSDGDGRASAYGKFTDNADGFVIELVFTPVYDTKQRPPSTNATFTRGSA